MKIGLLFLGLALLSAEVVRSEDYVEEDYINFRISEEPLERLAPYTERRMPTGGYLSFSYSQFEPQGYNPQYTTQTWDEVYKDLAKGIIDVTFQYKLNFFLGSLSLGFGVGLQSTESTDVSVVDSKLTLIPIRLEAVFALDSLFSNPTLVPYGLAGAYSVYFKEEQATLSYTGTTQAAPYFGGGIMFRIDGFFPDDSFNAYKENFQENSFVYLETRKWLASSNIQDPDFSTGLQFGGGVRFEF